MRDVYFVRIEIPDGADIVSHPVYVDDKTTADELIAYAKQIGLTANEPVHVAGYLTFDEAQAYLDRQVAKNG